MARPQKVSISFDFDPALVYARRIAAPHATYNGTNKRWMAPATEAAAFVARANLALQTAGRTATVFIDCRPVVLGMPATDVPVPVDAPSLQPSI